MHPRYAREWLEQQAVAGLLDADPSSGERRFALSPAHAAVLADPESLASFTPFMRLIGAAAVQLPALLETYRTGGGVGWSAYGEPMRTGQADANRPAGSPTSAAARAGRRSGARTPTRGH